MKRFAVILVAAVAFVASSCSSPLPGGSPTGPTPSACILAKAASVLPNMHLQWNGVVGDGKNFASYTDATCNTLLTGSGHYEYATVLSPAPPVPVPYASWVNVPGSISPQWQGTAEHAAAIAACSTLFGDVGTAVVVAGLVHYTVTASDNLPADMWSCVAIDLTTPGFGTQVRP